MKCEGKGEEKIQQEERLKRNLEGQGKNDKQKREKNGTKGNGKMEFRKKSKNGEGSGKVRKDSGKEKGKR